MFKKTIYFLFAVILCCVFVSFFYNKYFVKRDTSKTFSGIYEGYQIKRYKQYIFRISKDSILIFRSDSLNDELEKILSEGDSIYKIENFNKCFLFKTNKKTIELDFYEIN